MCFSQHALGLLNGLPKRRFLVRVRRPIEPQRIHLVSQVGEHLIPLFLSEGLAQHLLTLARIHRVVKPGVFALRHCVNQLVTAMP